VLVRGLRSRARVVQLKLPQLQPLLQVRGLVVAAAVSAIIAGLAAARARASAGTVFILTADEHIERGWVECVEVRWEET
jgi:hypothetical protein